MNRDEGMSSAVHVESFLERGFVDLFIQVVDVEGL